MRVVFLDTISPEGGGSRVLIPDWFIRAGEKEFVRFGGGREGEGREPRGR